MSLPNRNRKDLRARLLYAAVPLAILLFPALGRAEVKRIEIRERQPYANGKVYGEVGAYERIRGKVFFEVDPTLRVNRAIIDLELAKQNEKGRVEFSADLEILVPKDRSKANGAIFYDVNNRGNRVCLGAFNGGGADGFLMRQGYVIVWSGWLADTLPGRDRILLDAPVATKNGKPITGIVRAEFSSNEDVNKKSLANSSSQGSYPPTKRGLKEATLTWRLRQRDRRVLIPRSQWKLHQQYVEADGRRSLLPRIELELTPGIRSGYIYELIYEAEGPIVHGTGLAGIRDLLSYLKSEKSEKNPLYDAEHLRSPVVYGFGSSQSGRCLRQFLYDGFNEDEQGRQVFDAIVPFVAGGGMGFFNHRFASPTRHNAQHDSHQYPADVFPFAYGVEHDPFTERREGILSKARGRGVVPKVFHIQTSSEYWSRAGSLVHTDPRGRRDAKIPDEVRIYTIGGARHGAGSGVPTQGGKGQLPINPTDYRPLLRGLITALDQWVRTGEAPPPSVYPTISDGTLVPWQVEKSGWIPLRGVRYPKVIHQPDYIDRGPTFHKTREITIQPPKVAGRYVVRIPGYGSDNNERGCLLVPTAAVPVGSFTGWNLRSRDIGAETELLSLSGGYLPFASTKEVRQNGSDPRLSLQERYDHFETYQKKFNQSLARLVEQRYLLDEDIPRLQELSNTAEHAFR